MGHASRDQGSVRGWRTPPLPSSPSLPSTPWEAAISLSYPPAAPGHTHGLQPCLLQATSPWGHHRTPPARPKPPEPPLSSAARLGALPPPPSETKRGREELRLPNRSSSLPALWERRSASIAPAPLLRGGSGLAARWERCRCSQNGDCAPKRAPGTVTGEISEMGWGVSAPSQHPAPSGAERVAGREGPGATSSRPAELLAAGRAAQLARSFNRQLSRQLEAGAGFLLHEPCS